MTVRYPLFIVCVASLFTAPGCLGDVAPPGFELPEYADTRLGDSCDWQVADDCGPGFQCDRITDEGTYLEEGICLLAQGAPCPDPSAAGLVSEFCGRALSCQQLPSDPEVFLCLPNTCIDDSECRTGKSCRNNLCSPSAGGCLVV